ncbi:uncharacterized protein LOC131934845 [Physella acuta]|uniref:uncharacterized protein LOC131934845 n=1 Tax=Physella acuta TaxID=109671 RepID=UPI0027DB698E|nr:uncharacterized protein LOC131934845 [Physella acuta]
MDKTPLLLLLLIPALALAGPAEDEATKEYEAADTNKDGNLTEDEMKISLMEADKNGNQDGQIDLKEYIAVFKKYFSNAQDIIPTNLFQVYDVNKDTFVDDKDFKGLREKMDNDGDTNLTLKEFIKFVVPYLEPMYTKG